MGLKQNLKATMAVDVTVTDPEGTETVVEMTFKRVRMSELRQMGVGDDAKGITSLVTGWNAEHVGAPFSADELVALVDEAPWLPMCMLRSYAQALQGLIRKN